MKDLLKRLDAFSSSKFSVPIMLWIVAFLAYGLFFWQLGFYWDDLPISWIRYQFGPDAMRVYFSTSRPVWGELYQITTRLIPQIPADWQFLALVWRWITAILCWAVFRELWSRRPQTALIIASFFLLYPGFNLQWVSFVSSHFFIVLAFFLFSYLSMLWAFHHPKYFGLWTILALLFSALNLWMMEFFFFLELIRPFIIFADRAEVSPPKSSRDIWGLTLDSLKRWLPYLAVWLADVFYREFIFTNTAYKNALLSDLSSQPIATGINLVQTILSNLWLVSVQAWAQIFTYPISTLLGPRTILLYVIVILFAALIAGFVLFRGKVEDTDRRFALWLIAIGLLAIIVGGVPYWLAKVVMTLGFPATRFTISFMLGVSIFFAGLINLLPKYVRLSLIAIFIAFAAGYQALQADSFRRDWITQRDMFWQMTWRIPGLQPNTLLLINQGPLKYYADNSLGAALNWIYDPSNRSNVMPYALFFPTNRIADVTSNPANIPINYGAFPGFQPNLPVAFNYLIGTFSGTTSQVVGIYYEPPGCLRVLDPDIDSQNHFIPDESMMRDATRLSSSEWITSNRSATMPQVYGPEPVHGWCYYFEQADLARQLGDWSRVVQMGNIALHLDDYPNDPTERFVFIEGYAHEGKWSEVKDLALTSYKVSPAYVGPLLCKLLARIDRNVPASSDKESSLNQLNTKFECLP
jgi:hypothetical protein